MKILSITLTIHDLITNFFNRKSFSLYMKIVSKIIENSIVYYSIGFTLEFCRQISKSGGGALHFNAGFVKLTLQYFLVYFV